MAKFKPGESVPDEVLPAGEYLLGISWFERKLSRANKDYHRVSIKVVSGARKGKGFYTNLSLDLSKSGTAKRWNALCDALGITEEMEMGATAEGTAQEGDANFKRNFLGRAFKGVVSVKEENGYTNNEIQQIVYARFITDGERKQLKLWEDEFAAKNDRFGDPEDGSSEAPFSDFAPDDSDIPF